MAEVDGLEPSTIRLTGERSAIELHFSCSAKVGIAPTSRGSSNELHRILNYKSGVLLRQRGYEFLHPAKRNSRRYPYL
jgi:hypothetical protein